MEQTRTQTDTLLRGYPWRRYVVMVSTAIIALLLLIGFAFGLLALVNSNGELNPINHMLLLPFVTVVYGLIAVQINLRYPRHTIGWLLLMVAVFSALTFVAGTYTRFELYLFPDTDNELSKLMHWLSVWIWWIPSLVPLTFLLLYFPDGRLPSKRWRPVAYLTGIGLIGSVFATAFHPGPIPDYGIMTANPYGFPALSGILENLLNISILPLAIGFFASFASIVLRYRAAKGTVRTQLKWLVYAGAFVVISLLIFMLLSFIIPDNPLVMEGGIFATTLGTTLIICAIGIAILKHQLWDIERFINRTIVYSILSVTTIAIYMMVVTFLSTVFDGDNVVFSLVATGLVAVSFQTIREYLQGNINRLMFGNRDEPYLVLERLSKQLDPVMPVNEVLPAIVHSIGEAVRLPYVAIVLIHDGHSKVVATYPENTERPETARVITIPLEYQSDPIGHLILASHSQDGIFSPAERNLMETVARQTSIAAHNVLLTQELQRSREELVTTREEERRRLRRDLHDGLGPVLAAMSFRLDAVQNLIDSDSNQAKSLASELKGQVQSSLSEIRRIAYNLRPPALDELGLIGALREHLVALDTSGTVKFSLDAPQEIQALSAAVEVATYHIALEAVTNVQRHAQARHCTVRLTIDNALNLEISDDGQGIADNQRAGVGLTTMQERASELGGRCIIENRASGGTIVSAVLPLSNTA